MPIYEYRCNACGHQLEKLQRMSEEPLTDCPACNKAALRRLISAAGFRLKGSGWYETDFKKDNKRNVADSSSESSDKASKKDTESKPETKPSDNGKGGKDGKDGKVGKSASASETKTDKPKASAA